MNCILITWEKTMSPAARKAVRAEGRECVREAAALRLKACRTWEGPASAISDCGFLLASSDFKATELL
jgi:hypothetical protein